MPSVISLAYFFSMGFFRDFLSLPPPSPSVTTMSSNSTTDAAAGEGAGTPHFDQLLHYLTGEQKLLVEKHLCAFATGKRGRTQLLITGPTSCGKTTLMQVARSLGEKHKVCIRGGGNAGPCGREFMVSTVPPQDAETYAAVVVPFKPLGAGQHWRRDDEERMVQHPCIAVVKDLASVAVAKDMMRFGPCSWRWLNDGTGFIHPTVFNHTPHFNLGCYDWKAPAIVIVDLDVYPSVHPLFKDNHCWDKLVMPEIPEAGRIVDLSHKLKKEMKYIAARVLCRSDSERAEKRARQDFNPAPVTVAPVSSLVSHDDSGGDSGSGDGGGGGGGVEAPPTPLSESSIQWDYFLNEGALEPGELALISCAVAQIRTAVEHCTSPPVPIDLTGIRAMVETACRRVEWITVNNDEATKEKLDQFAKDAVETAAWTMFSEFGDQLEEGCSMHYSPLARVLLNSRNMEQCSHTTLPIVLKFEVSGKCASAIVRIETRWQEGCGEYQGDIQACEVELDIQWTDAEALVQQQDEAGCAVHEELRRLATLSVVFADREFHVADEAQAELNKIVRTVEIAKQLIRKWKEKEQDAAVALETE